MKWQWQMQFTGVICDQNWAKRWMWIFWWKQIHLQCIQKVFTVLHLFHFLSCYSLIQKWIHLVFPSKFYTQYSIIPKWKGLSEIIEHLLKIKNKKYNMYISIHSLYSLLWWRTLAAITGLSIFEYDATSLVHAFISTLTGPLSKSIMLPPTCFTIGMVVARLPGFFTPKKVNLYFIRPEFCFSCSETPSVAF